MMQEHSNRPQCFKMKGETVIICESVDKKFLTQVSTGQYTAPSRFVGDKEDFLTAIDKYLSKFNEKQREKFSLIGFIKMESQIKEDTYEQYIRNVFYLRYYGDDSQIAEFKTAEDILKNSQDQSFINYINYIRNGGLAYPTELFVYEGASVKLPSCKTPFQQQKLQLLTQQQLQQKNTVK